MKKVLILFSLSLIISLSGYAQNNKRTSAYMYSQNGQYDKALEAINEAIQHPKTENDAKTWLYRGMIYYNIAIDTTGAFDNLVDGDAAVIAAESFKKSKEYDEKNRYENDREKFLIYMPDIFYRSATEAYQNQDFNAAVEGFKNAFDIAQLSGRVDTAAAYYVGMCAVMGEQYDIADEYLQKCVDYNFNEPNIYIYYSRSLKNQGDTLAAAQKLDKGVELFPENNTLQLEQAQLYLETGQDDKLIKSLQDAIASDPLNENLYRVLGQTYENLGDEENAILNYKKAVEINPEFADAIFNLGAIYVNKASEIYKEANDLGMSDEEMKRYEVLKEEAEGYLHQALPYLEKSHEINPDDEIVVGALKEAYANLRMNDKLKELQDK